MNITKAQSEAFKMISKIQNNKGNSFWVVNHNTIKPKTLDALADAGLIEIKKEFVNSRYTAWEYSVKITVDTRSDT
jgi:hypothetical protein